MTLTKPFERYVGTWIRDEYRWHFVYEYLFTKKLAHFKTVNIALNKPEKGHYGNFAFDYDSESLYYFPEESDFRKVISIIFERRENE